MTGSGAVLGQTSSAGGADKSTTSMVAVAQEKPLHIYIVRCSSEMSSLTVGPPAPHVYRDLSSWSELMLITINGKVTLEPYVGKAVATAQLGSSSLEGEELAFGIQFGRRWVAGQATEIEEIGRAHV